MSNLLLLSTLCTLPTQNYQAQMSIYDPMLGGINCNGNENCWSVSMGEWYEWMYGVSGACPSDLYGAHIRFDAPIEGLPTDFYCVDTGPAIRTFYEPWPYAECRSWFDVLWPLHDEDPPFWTWWLLDFEVVEWGGAWYWYQENKSIWASL